MCLHTAAKTMTYSVMHMVIAFLVAYAISLDWRVAISISLIEPAVQTVAYYFHEKLWTKKTARKPKLRHA